MNKLLFLGFSAFLLGNALNALSDPVKPNLVINGQLAGNANWTISRSEVLVDDVSHATDGSGSAALSNAYADSTAGYDYLVTRTYAVQPQEKLNLSFFSRSEQAGAGRANIYLTFRDQAGSWLTNTMPIVASNQTEQWREYSRGFDVPNNAHQVQVQMLMAAQNGQESEVIFVDDVRLERELKLPHLQRNTANNLISNPNLDGLAGWWLSNSGIYDLAVSRQLDDSGAFHLITSYQDDPVGYDSIASNTYKVDAGKLYSLSAYIKSAQFPAPVGAIFISFRDQDKNFLVNSTSSFESVSKPNEWQEVVTQVRVPEGAHYAQVRIIMSKQHQETQGTLWVDDIFLGEGISFEQAPSEKEAFSGSQIKVDKLGNVQRYKNGQWLPFIPLCIHADNSRPDWTVYSNQGFNCNMWAGSQQYIDKAKQAVSGFNPDGMLSSLDITGFIMPNHPNYANIELLQSRINEIKTAGLESSLLFYYWDNEHQGLSEWTMPQQVSVAIREQNTGHPIYMLQGMQGVTRKYSAGNGNIIDITGDYINVNTYRDSNGFDVLTNIEQQTAPVTIAQLNFETGKRFRARMYAALIKGAKGFSVWRDQYTGSTAQADKVENALWWQDLPSLRREIEQLTPLIREPHWVNWTIQSTDKRLDIGGRELNDKAYIIIANEHDQAISTVLTIDDLHYSVTSVKDFFNAQELSMTENQIAISIPAYGSKVLLLEP